MGSGKPTSIEDLADEAMEGWDAVLGPSSLASIRELILEMYETHPVMQRLAAEALVSARVAPDESAPEPKDAADAARMRKLRGG